MVKELFKKSVVLMIEKKLKRLNYMRMKQIHVHYILNLCLSVRNVVNLK